MITKTSDKQPLKLDTLFPGAIRIYSTSNVHVARQLGFWWETRQLYQYTSCSGFGFVVITDALAPSLSASLAAWAIFKPCGLWLSWGQDKDVVQVEIPLKRGVRWYNLEGRQWEHIASKHGHARYA